MADLYYHVWVTATSLTIIILVAAYIIYDRIAMRHESIADETEKQSKMDRLNIRSMIILGALAVVGGLYWLYFVQTHEIYITKSLRGAHDIIPPIFMALVGTVLLVVGTKKHLANRT